jgi:hypothetical protein
MAGVGRSRTQACPRGRFDASACPSDLVWNNDVNALIASSFIFLAGRGGFTSRRDVQHKRVVKIADKLAHSVRIPVFIVCAPRSQPDAAFALRQSEALAMIERQRGAIALGAHARERARGIARLSLTPPLYKPRVSASRVKWLRGIAEPIVPGYELRNFECPNCGNKLKLGTKAN